MSGLLCCGAAYGIVEDASSNPYQGIIDRNVFGLKPPPPPPAPESQLPPAPKVTITGITTILGNKRVLLKVAIPAKGTEPAKELTPILAEGQRDGEIEVLTIDEKSGDVKLNDYGTLMTLNIEKDGAKLAAAPPAPGTPGGPLPGVANPAAGATHAAFNPAGGYNPGKLALPSRALRTNPNAASNPGMGGIGVPAASGYPVAGTAGVLGTPLVSTTPGGTPAVTVTPGFQATPPGAMRNWPPEVPMTPEEQAILIEVERERNANNPNYAPLPPTPITPGAQTPASQTPGNPAIPPPGPPLPPR